MEERKEHKYAVYLCSHGIRHTWRGCFRAKDGKEMCDNCCIGIIGDENDGTEKGAN